MRQVVIIAFTKRAVIFIKLNSVVKQCKLAQRCIHGMGMKLPRVCNLLGFPWRHASLKFGGEAATGVEERQREEMDGHQLSWVIWVPTITATYIWCCCSFSKGGLKVLWVAFALCLLSPSLLPFVFVNPPPLCVVSTSSLLRLQSDDVSAYEIWNLSCKVRVEFMWST